jgi:hypothetical protein
MPHHWSVNSFLERHTNFTIQRNPIGRTTPSSLAVHRCWVDYWQATRSRRDLISIRHHHTMPLGRPKPNDKLRIRIPRYRARKNESPLAHSSCHRCDRRTGAMLGHG